MCGEALLAGDPQPRDVTQGSPYTPLHEDPFRGALGERKPPLVRVGVRADLWEVYGRRGWRGGRGRSHVVGYGVGLVGVDDGGRPPVSVLRRPRRPDHRPQDLHLPGGHTHALAPAPPQSLQDLSQVSQVPWRSEETQVSIASPGQGVLDALEHSFEVSLKTLKLIKFLHIRCYNVFSLVSKYPFSTYTTNPL